MTTKHPLISIIAVVLITASVEYIADLLAMIF